MVEAAGVELSGVLITPKLLILGIATRAKKASLPNPLYVYCTKMLSLCSSAEAIFVATVSHGFAGWIEKSTQPPRSNRRALRPDRLTIVMLRSGEASSKGLFPFGFR
jgi:hypothetical protein